MHMTLTPADRRALAAAPGIDLALGAWWRCPQHGPTPDPVVLTEWQGSHDSPHVYCPTDGCGLVVTRIPPDHRAAPARGAAVRREGGPRDQVLAALRASGESLRVVEIARRVRLPASSIGWILAVLAADGTAIRERRGVWRAAPVGRRFRT